mmetsp:Transcript_21945/g.34385  ORF Transcript_21945/g.34385 Transcript_21945/m.34385 type:complete len:203 (+) Transcript_21945:814-1422(+)
MTPIGLRRCRNNLKLPSSSAASPLHTLSSHRTKKLAPKGARKPLHQSPRPRLWPSPRLCPGQSKQTLNPGYRPRLRRQRECQPTERATEPPGLWRARKTEQRGSQRTENLTSQPPIPPSQVLSQPFPLHENQGSRLATSRRPLVPQTRVNCHQTGHLPRGIPQWGPPRPKPSNGLMKAPRATLSRRRIQGSSYLSQEHNSQE